jgi:hypothetical protein
VPRVSFVVPLKDKLLNSLEDHIWYIRICLIAPYFPNKSYMSSEDILYGKFLTNNILLTSGGNLAYIMIRMLKGDGAGWLPWT